MNKRPYFIRAEWDEEVNVFVASSDDVPGLATEGETLEGLIEKLKIMIPELLEANGMDIGLETSFEVFTRRFEIAHRAAV
jgi:predicted RNase H-like HicB family nuclease